MVDRELREYELVDRIVVPSEPARLSFLRRGVDPSKVVKVPYGVDVRAFTPPSARRHPGAIVSVATVGLTKGQRYLVEAFRSLHSSSASLTLVGPMDPGWDVRLDLARGDVRLTGAVPRARVVEELQHASIFVLASLQEGLALVISQAMACGLPVIATEATGVRELVDDGVEGFVVPAGDAQAIAESLAVLLDHPERAVEMGRAGRARVESLGGWDEYGSRLLQVFDGARAEHA
jgi:glycosyltransferase involved in cell wall biosynthesis